MRNTAFCGFALWIPLAGVSAAVERRPSPRFEGKNIPAPPEQESPWTPPRTKLPEIFVTATETLFRQGLADPRGCEYREIKVGTGSCWSGDAGVVKTHGWVLPQEPRAKRGTKQRFAVCWNGLVCPVVSIGAEADCRADVEALLKQDRALVEKQLARHEEREAARKEETVAKGEKYHRFPPFIRHHGAIGEPRSVSHASMLPIKAPVLLRLGHADFAEGLWTQWFAGREKKAGEDPYLLLATDSTWALFDRAVCAHMRGDDNLALVSSRALVPIRKTVETTAEKRGFKRLAMGRKKRPHLGFLEQLPALLADQERRAREPERGRQPSLNELPKDERIVARIEMMDEVAARQWGQPGGVSLGQDPIVQALIEEGDDAVEPLLKCLKEDTRLTRSVHFHRDFFTHRTIMGVHEAAYVALAGILKTSFFGAGSTGDNLTSRGMEGRRAVADSIRAYWRKHRGIPLEERWYRTLADDDASAKQWLQAAGNIVMPTNVSVVPGSTVFTSTLTTPAKPGEKPGMRGEILREKRAPSVAELMAKRVDFLSDYGAPGSEREFAMHKACSIALCLGKWDARAALPTLRRQVGRCRERMAAKKGSESSTIQRYGSFIGNFALVRARGGDKAALKEYADWIRTTSPRSVASYELDALKPIWRHPDHPATAEAAEWFFNDDESPWSPLLRSREEGGSYRLRDLLATPLVGVEGFRRYLLTELSDRSAAGSAALAENGCVKVRVDGAWSGGGAWYGGDPLAPERGTKIAFRRCDLFAWELSKLDGTPMCEVYWPEAKRDEAVSACAAFIRQYGDRFRYSEVHRELGRGMRTDEARMTFPRLDHPATAEEMKRRTAIFSLEDEGETRLWRMPEFPMKAKWVALKDYPRERLYRDPKTKKDITRLEYEQDGLVWQAEEVLKGGRWERYYGFVGRYCVARVQAAEIEFPADRWKWRELSGGIDCQVSRPGEKTEGGWVTLTRLGVGGPLNVTVKLRNRSGLERKVPSVLCRKEPGAPPALLSGMHVTLRYSPETVSPPRGGSPQGTLMPRAEDEKGWRVIAPKVAARFAASGERRVLAPTEEIDAFTLDLNDCFEITKPGSYRLKFVFTKDSGLGKGDPPRGGESNEVSFSLARARARRKAQ